MCAPTTAKALKMAGRFCPGTNTLPTSLAKAGLVARPGLRTAKATSMPGVRNPQLVNTANIHTGGRRLRGLRVTLLGSLVGGGVVVQERTVVAAVFGKSKCEQRYVDIE